MNQAFHIIDHFVILGVNIERNGNFYFIQNINFYIFIDLFTEASLKELTCIEFLFFHPKLEKNEIPKYLENFQLVKILKYKIIISN